MAQDMPTGEENAVNTHLMEEERKEGILQSVDGVMKKLAEIRSYKMKELIYLENKGRLIKFRPKGRSVCEAVERFKRLNLFDICEIGKYQKSRIKKARRKAKPPVITKTLTLTKALREHAQEDARLLQSAYEIQLNRYPRKIPVFSEPKRRKTHWDYLLSEMRWMAADFSKERRWKIAHAKNIANMASEAVQNRKLVEKDKEEREKRTKSHTVSLMIEQFWGKAKEYSKLRQGRNGKESYEQLIQSGFKANILKEAAKGFSNLRSLHGSAAETRAPPSPFNNISGNKDSIFLFDLQRSKAAEGVLNEKEVTRLYGFLKVISDSADSLKPKSGHSGRKVGTRIPATTLSGGRLREYQHVSLHWMVSLYSHNLSFILAYESGMGRKVAAVSFFAYLAEERQDYGPHLILCSRNSVLNWEFTCKKWCPSMKTFVCDEFGKQIKVQTRLRSRRANKFRIVIAPIEIVDMASTGENDMLLSEEWSIVMLDCAEYLILSKRKELVKERLSRVRSKGRFLLTDYSIAKILLTKNAKMLKYWADLLSFLIPEVGSEKLLQLMAKRKEFADIHTILNPLVLSMNMDDVISELTPIDQERIILCPRLYRQSNEYNSLLEQGRTRSCLRSGNDIGIADVLRRLRNICNHPDLADDLIFNTPFLMKEEIAPTIPKFFYIRNRKIADADLAPKLRNLCSLALLSYIARNEVALGAINIDVLLDAKRAPRSRTKRRRQAKAELSDRFLINSCRLNQFHAVYSYSMVQIVLMKQMKRYLCKLCEQAENSAPEHILERSTLIRKKLFRLPVSFMKIMREFPRSGCNGENPSGYQSESEADSDSSGASGFSTGITGGDAGVFGDISLLLAPGDILKSSGKVYAKFRAGKRHKIVNGTLMRGANRGTYFDAQDGIMQAKLGIPQSDSGKLWVLKGILDEIGMEGERCAILTQSSEMLKRIEDFIAIHVSHMNVLALRRDIPLIEMYNLICGVNFDGEASCILTLERIAGRYLDILNVSKIIFFDADWNPLVRSATRSSILRILLSGGAEIVRLASDDSIEVPLTITSCTSASGGEVISSNGGVESAPTVQIAEPGGFSFELQSMVGSLRRSLELDLPQYIWCDPKALVNGGWRTSVTVESKQDKDLFASFDKDFRMERSVLLSNYISGTCKILKVCYDYDCDMFECRTSDAEKDKKLNVSTFLINLWENWKYDELESTFLPVEHYAVQSFLEGSFLGDMISHDGVAGIGGESQVDVALQKFVDRESDKDWFRQTPTVVQAEKKSKEFFYDMSDPKSVRSREAHSLSQFYTGRMEETSESGLLGTNEDEFFSWQPDLIHPPRQPSDKDQDDYSYPHFFYMENESVSSLLPLKKLKSLRMQYSLMSREKEEVAQRQEEREGEYGTTKRKLRKRKTRYDAAAAEGMSPWTPEKGDTPEIKKKAKKEEEQKKEEMTLLNVWTEQEDKLILSAVRMFGINWLLISTLLSCLDHVPGKIRTEMQCLERHQVLELTDATRSTSNLRSMQRSLRSSASASASSLLSGEMGQSHPKSGLEAYESQQNRLQSGKKSSISSSIASANYPHKFVLKAIKSAMSKKKTMLNRIGLGDKPVSKHASYDAIMNDSAVLGGKEALPSKLLEFFRKRDATRAAAAASNASKANRYTMAAQSNRGGGGGGVADAALKQQLEGEAAAGVPSGSSHPAAQTAPSVGQGMRYVPAGVSEQQRTKLKWSISQVPAGASMRPAEDGSSGQAGGGAGRGRPRSHRAPGALAPGQGEVSTPQQQQQMVYQYQPQLQPQMQASTPPYLPYTAAAAAAHTSQLSHHQQQLQQQQLQHLGHHPLVGGHQHQHQLGGSTTATATSTHMGHHQMEQLLPHWQWCCV